jgi:membrane peptidoglycan carboxypeptidase
MGGDTDAARAGGEDNDVSDNEPAGYGSWGGDYPDGAAIWHDFDARYPEADEREPGSPRARRRKSLAALGAAAVALVVLGGIALYSAVSGHGAQVATAASDATTAEAVVASTADTDDAVDSQVAQSTAQAFLKAWQSGDDAAAAALTDSPSVAKAALDAYHSDLHVSALVTRLTDTDESGDVGFSVAATVHLPAGSSGAHSAAASGTWSYSSQLAVYSSSGQTRIQWAPDVLAPNLTADTHLMLMPISPDGGQTIVTDKQKNDLSDSSESTLQKIAEQLGQGAGVAGTGTPGIDVAVVDDSGSPVDGMAPAVVTPPGALQIATTIDANVQKAASAAVQRNQQSSMVVIQPSTGDILAIANNDGGLDNALMAQIAPGSTMKVVTSTAMLNQGMSMDSDVGCPASLDVQDAVTHNSDGESRPSDTPLIDDFAVSCNNAFAEQYHLLSGDLLARTAQKYFGLNEPWDIGLGQPTRYFTIPTGQPDKEVAAEAFGQGALEASPLAMASVAATVATGSFHQPVVIPGAEQVSASDLPSGTDSQLKAMMRAVVTYPDGTAHGIGFGSGVYVKTGTAEDQPGYQPNSWIIVADPSLDIAIGCVVLSAGAGDQYAGPEALSVIKALS